MELIIGNQLELAVSNSATSFFDKLVLQKELLSNQIYELENLVNTQCMLTGVNPLSQEMAAGALCVKIGKRPRDLLNPKAIQYMQFIFSIKDAINKKETREIIAQFGVTASQVRDFFTSQRAKVRKFIRLSREKVKRTTSMVVPDGIQDGQDPAEPLNNPVPLDTVAPTSNTEVVHSFSAQEEKLSPAVVEAERYFVDNIFNLMRKEETFSGQAKLMEWILQIQNTSVLFWFSVNGGIMILATWLSEAIVEEQTSVLHVILKAQKRANGKKTDSPSLDDMLLTQCINEVMDDDVSWDPKAHLNGDLSGSLEDSSGNLRKLDSSPLKLLTASDDQNKKLITGGRSSQSRERRKVLLVEQPGQRSATRSTQVSRHTTNAAQRRPLSADDIQKAKIRAQFMQSRYGKPPAPSSDENTSQAQINIANKNTVSESSILQQPVHNIKVEEKSKIDNHQPVNNINVEEKGKIDNHQPVHDIKVEEKSKIDNHPTKISNQPDASVDNVVVEIKSDEPPPKKSRRMEIKWNTPPEVEIDISWRVGTGENSKEVEIQKHRLRRELETVYKTIHEIPSDPKAPWDREMDYDDTLTPQIPIDQLPDDTEETPTMPNTEEQNPVNSIGLSSLANTAGPDLELLAELLKNPQLVFALTSGQGGNLSSDQTVRLLDMIKKNGVNSLNSLTDFGGKKEAESKIEVSLPSPTPSSDPVTNGRIADLSKNPFSRGKQVVNDTSHLVQPSQIFQEYLPATYNNLVQPQLQHLTSTTTTASRVSSLQQQSPVHHHQTSTTLYVPEMQQASFPESHTRNTGHNPHVITPAALPPYDNHHRGQPPHWRQNEQDYHHHHHHPTIDHHHHHQNNHNTETNQAYGGHQFLEDEGRFETWDPEDSPARSRGWSNSSSHYRPVAAPRNYGHPPPHHHHQAAYGGDQTWNSGNKRWNDRRR